MAIRFLLQPSEVTTVYVLRRQAITRSLPVLQGETVVWQFEVGLYDIDFSVRFEPGAPTLSPLPQLVTASSASAWSSRSRSPPRSDSGGSEPEIAAMAADPSVYARCNALSSGGALAGSAASAGGEAGFSQVVHKPTRYSTLDGRPAQGSYTCPADGKVTLTWDNSFSRFRGKHLSFTFDSVTPSTMRAAIEAADATARKSARPETSPRCSPAPQAAAAAAAAAETAAAAAEAAAEALALSSLQLFQPSSSPMLPLEPPQDSGAGVGAGLRILVDSVDTDDTEGAAADASLPASAAGSGSPVCNRALRAAAATTPEKWDGGSSGPGADAAGGGFSVRGTAAALLQYAYSWAYFLPSGAAGAGAGGAGSSATATGGAAGVAALEGSDAAGSFVSGSPAERRPTRATAASASPATRGAEAERYAKGIEELVSRYEALEDELAITSARRAQSAAQAKTLLARLHNTGVEKERLERRLAEMEGKLGDAVAAGREAAAAAAAAVASTEEARGAAAALEERLVAAQRERDLLQAERNVWQVARCGIQMELSRVASALELEKQAHDDSRRALARAHEAQQRLELENKRLGERLAAQGEGGEALLEKAQTEARLAREEAEDARAALAEGEAELATLVAHKRVLVSELRSQRRRLGDEAAAARAEAEEARMMQRAMEGRLRDLEGERSHHTALQAKSEVKLSRLRAERRVLVSEVRRAKQGLGGSSSGGNTGSVKSDEGTDADADFDMDDVAAAAGAAGGSGTGTSGVAGSGLGGGGQEAGSGPGGGGQEAGCAAAKPEAAALVKLLSRQLVHLRERRQQLREEIELQEAKGKDVASAAAAAAIGRESMQDLSRAIDDLQTRIRKLLVSAHGPVSSGGAER